MDDNTPIDEQIVVVGVCGAGKSTLVRGLHARGYPARVCVQEHSYVPTLFLRHGRPRLLVYLHASLETVCRRCQVTWTSEVLAQQEERLAQARQQCDLYVDTDPLTASEVLEAVVAFVAHGRQTPHSVRGDVATSCRTE